MKLTRLEKLFARVIRDEVDDIMAMRKCRCSAPKAVQWKRHESLEYLSCTKCIGVVHEDAVKKGEAHVRDGRLQ